MSRRSHLLALIAVLMIGPIVPALPSRAQDNTITITVAVPSFNKEAFSDKLLGDFEAAHPGVKVQVVTDISAIPPAALGVDKHLDEVQKYIASADVLYVD